MSGLGTGGPAHSWPCSARLAARGGGEAPPSPSKALLAAPRHPPPVPLAFRGPSQRRTCPGPQRPAVRGPGRGRPGGGARGRSCAALTLFIPLSLQGIERLKRKHQPREYRGSWKFVQDIFGGTFSLNWFNPFSGPWHPKPLSDGDWVQQAASTSETDNTEMTEERSGDTKDEDSVEVTDE